MLTNRIFLKPLLIFISVIAFNMAVEAQTQGPDSGAPDPGGDPAPLDGGISLLLAAGAAYGVKKYREGRKKEEADKG